MRSRCACPRRHHAPQGRVALHARAAGRRRTRVDNGARQLRAAARGRRRAHPAGGRARGTPARRRTAGAAVDGRQRRREPGAARAGREVARVAVTRAGTTWPRNVAWLWTLCALLWCVAPAVHAHKPSDSYLTITQSGDGLSGRWDIALRDLDFAIGLDADGDGALTWGEVRARHGDIAAYAVAHLALSADEQPCSLQAGTQMLEDHTDGTYTVMPLVIACANASPSKLTIRYPLLADLDPQHRGLLNLQARGLARPAVLDPQAPVPTFDLAQANRWQQFADYLREGIWHIWVGYDHILFLLSLLLPAV